MLPLASVGFLTAGLFFCVYAYTFASLIKHKLPGLLHYYAHAFYTIAVAFFIWGIAAYVNTPGILAFSLLVGDLLLFLSSYFLLFIFFRDYKSRSYLLFAFLIFAVFFTLLRVYYYPPAPYMYNGIFIFNTPAVVAAFVSIVLLTVWLPASIKVSRLISRRLKVKSTEFVFSTTYILAIISVFLLISAKTIPLIILSFACLVFIFIVLISTNILIDKLSN